VATVEELREEAKELEIKGYSGLNKADLEKEVAEARRKMVSARESDEAPAQNREASRTISGAQAEQRTDEALAAERTESPEDRAQQESAQRQQQQDDKTPQRVREIQQAQGLGGTGDTGEARTIEEREEAASASSFKGGGGRDTPSDEVEVRNRQAQEAAGEEETTENAAGQRAELESRAYFSSAIRDAVRTVRSALRGVRNVEVDARGRRDNVQMPKEWVSALEALEGAVDQFSKTTGAS
jgi:hypothetical protein